MDDVLSIAAMALKAIIPDASATSTTVASVFAETSEEPRICSLPPRDERVIDLTTGDGEGPGPPACISELMRPATRSGVSTTSEDVAAPSIPIANAPEITTKGWTLEGLVADGFKPVERVSALTPPDELAAKVLDYEARCIPLIVEGCHEHALWNREIFNMDWLLKNADPRAYQKAFM